MSANAPYWGDLPDPRQLPIQTPDDSGAGGGPNLSTTTALLQPKPNRASTQTTNTDAPTEPAFTPYASPTNSQFPGQGLAPRPPSLAYNADFVNAAHAQQQHPDQNTPGRIYQGTSSRDADIDYSGFPPDNHDQFGHYTQHSDSFDLPPAAPDVPRGPPLSYRPPNINTTNYGYPPSSSLSSPRSAQRQDFQATGDPMDIDTPDQYYMTGAGPAPHGAVVTRAPDGSSRIPSDPSSAPRGRRQSVSGGARPQLVTAQQAIGIAAHGNAPQRRVSVSTGGNQADQTKKFDSVRSPLQKLELTLDSITKEEKRARVAAAEQAARDRQQRRAAERSASQQPPQEQQPHTQPRQYSQPQPQPQPQQVHLTQSTRSQPPNQQHPQQPQQRPQLPQLQQPQHFPQQVRFYDQPLPAADFEPRPLLQPDVSPVEEPYQYPDADRPPLSEFSDGPPPPPPDSEKPQSRQAQHHVPAAESGIPQRNLSFRERAARNDVKLPRAKDLLPTESDRPTAGPNVIPQRQSSIRATKLHKDPPDDPWYSKRADSEKHHPAVLPETGPLQHDYALSDAVPRTLPAETAEASLHVHDSVPQPRFVPQSAQTPIRPQPQTTLPVHQPAKLVKSPSQRRPQPGVYANPDPNRTTAQNAHTRGLDGPFDSNGGSLADAAVAAGAVGAVGAVAGAADGAPVKRTARFEDDVYDNSNDQQSRQDRHFNDPHHHHISKMVYRARNNFLPGQGKHKRPEYLDEWKQGIVGTLSGPLLDLNDQPGPPSDSDKAWWETNGRRRGSISGARPRKAEAFDGEYDEANGPSRFKPPLHLVCGPLLRYCGIRKETSVARNARNGNSKAPSEKEFWRGSVMIVTRDTDSSYDIAPMLRLFVQPLELLSPPPTEVQGTLPPEHVDPLVGHPKLGRNGETLYVRPVEQLQEAKDLSRDETDTGLFEKTRSTADSTKDAAADSPGSFSSRLKKAQTDGEKVGKFKDVRGFRLHVERGVTFWRFNIEVELRDHQQRIAYRINRGPSTGFWVPAKDQSMHIMFYSCNGFSQSVDSDQFSGPDPMWRDVLNNHQTQPFHVMIGGGDQLYNDAVMNQTQIFRDWLSTRNPVTKGNAPFTPEMQDELEAFYLNRYAMWFSQGLFSLANSQIPMVNMYDDHDIIDGFGSYPHHFMNSPVFAGLGNIAFKYYMLFQHQSVVGETEESEPSWILGQSPGPYIEEVSRSVFMHLGAKVALLAVDCRTERTRDDVLQDETWKRIIDRCYAELEKGKTEHLLVQLGVPVAYPRLVWLENILTSRLMEPVKMLGKTGLLGNFLNHFDGGVEILDDLDDHWTAKSHKDERKVIIEDLQDLAADKSVRITLLSGDVHLAAIGRFYSNTKQKLVKHKDFRYMPNVISSAIANTPPPDLLADILNKRNKIHHFDKETDEDMIPIFGHGVDGKPRNNKTLLPHRNWCSIQPYAPGSTPPGTPNQSEANVTANGTPNGSRKNFFSRTSSFQSHTYNGNDPSRPPLSGGLLRRLSTRGRRSVDSVAQQPVVGVDGGAIRYAEDDQSTVSSVEDVPGGSRYIPQQARIRGGAGSPTALGAGVGGDYSHNEFENGDESYFSVRRRPVGAGRGQTAPDVHGASGTTLEASEGGAGPPVRPFYRTPTGLTAKQAKKKDFEVNLEGGLDIRLNVEVNPKDPSGITVPYRLVVPRLWYTYQPEDLGEDAKAPTGLKRLLSMGRKPAPRQHQEQQQEFHPGQSESDESSPLGEQGGMMN
ncbi:hypothetical protein F503_05182 [Ophiostoma piceae UAMH 11346]|uniref:PhoD-like phosphatase domain-containing protein n=1 Tax=Ophiostoma piceae (strain UAMH 11346) TaxID=1262450 RepID=S3CB02_OPHP1|nr:hypothetical protein F503_05182 [Ophiostoma piceae UAMH 11346]